MADIAPASISPARPWRARWYRPMLGRDPGERHRVATTLELFFDLCFVVAVAQAASHLHHDLSENHVGHGVVSYLMVFFAIWWAWLNFSWFASAYDVDDAGYRVTTMVQIGGALILAAGVPRAFTDGDFSVITYGYVVMRLALVTQWLRAAASDVARRPAAVRFAIGVTAVQIGWVVRLALPEKWLVPGFLVLVVAELAVPWWAERRTPTPWHPHHIAERYGLFTIIVLGESVLAATVAFQSAADTGHFDASLVLLGAAGLVIVFAMWWLYFAHPTADLLTSLRRSLLWGYGHYFLFAATAAVGAGLAVAVDTLTHAAHLSARAAGFAIAIPVAVYLLVVWLFRIPLRQPRLVALAFPGTALLVLAAPLTPAPVPVVAVLLAALVTTVVLVGDDVPDRGPVASP